MPTRALVQERKELLNGGDQGGSHPLHRGSVAPPALLPSASQGMKPLLWKTRATTPAHAYGHACASYENTQTHTAYTPGFLAAAGVIHSRQHSKPAAQTAPTCSWVI